MPTGKHPAPGDAYKRPDPGHREGGYFALMDAWGDHNDDLLPVVDRSVVTVLAVDWHPSYPRPSDWPVTTNQCLVVVGDKLVTIIIERGYWERVKV